jgi:hypothetical protein
MTLEQFETGFMRDLHPESEVALWCRITKAWLAYHEDFLANETQPDEEERKLLGALIAISTGMEDVSKLNVPASSPPFITCSAFRLIHSSAIRPTPPADLIATVYHLLGVPPDTQLRDQTDRPHALLAGNVIHDLLV